jgi:hypothetical protein
MTGRHHKGRVLFPDAAGGDMRATACFMISWTPMRALGHDGLNDLTEITFTFAD